MKFKFLIVIFSVLLSSCASTHQYYKIAQPNEVKSEMATIYVLRKASLGTMVKFHIYQGDKLIGKLGPKSYLVWEVPGDGQEISIVSESENSDELYIKPQAGKTYYIHQKVKVGLVLARSEILLVDEAEGKAMLEELKAPKPKYAE